MKSLIKTLLAMCLILTMLASSLVLPVTAVNDGKMAYNIYARGDQSATSGHFDSYLIDFMTTEAPEATYWALANYGMFTRSEGTKKLFGALGGGGAYCGLQNTGSQVAIMSFWQWTYGRKQIHNAKRMFPKGENVGFDNEGSGVKWIAPYNWQPGNWYRMALHAWTDVETGTTMVGTWYLDLESGEWTLFCYYDTGLVDSYMTGDMSLFMENYGSWNSAQVREVRFKNMYVLDHEDNKWYSMPKAKMTCDDSATNKKGTIEFGSTDEYFWGKTNGIDMEDQKAYMRTIKKSYTATITQPEQPTLSASVAPELSVKKTDKGLRISWKADKKSAPQQAYTVELIDANGTVIADESASRPEVNKVDFTELSTTEVTVKLTVTDIFGGKSEVSTDTDALTIAKGMPGIQAFVDEMAEKKPTKEWKEPLESLLADCNAALENGITKPEQLEELQARIADLQEKIEFRTGPSPILYAAIGGGVLLLAVVLVLVLVLGKKKSKKN